MIPEKDIWRCANLMWKRYGEDAELKAAVRADKLLDDGDTEGAATWRRILAAIEELRRDKPRDGELVN